MKTLASDWKDFAIVFGLAFLPTFVAALVLGALFDAFVIVMLVAVVYVGFVAILAAMDRVNNRT